MLSKYILIVILFIFILKLVLNLPNISKKIDLLYLDDIKTKIDLAKKFNKTYRINLKNVKVEGQKICIEEECINTSYNVSIKGGILYVGN